MHGRSHDHASKFLAHAFIVLSHPPFYNLGTDAHAAPVAIISHTSISCKTWTPALYIAIRSSWWSTFFRLDIDILAHHDSHLFEILRTFHSHRLNNMLCATSVIIRSFFCAEDVSRGRAYGFLVWQLDVTSTSTWANDVGALAVTSISTTPELFGDERPNHGCVAYHHSHECLAASPDGRGSSICVLLWIRLFVSLEVSLIKAYLKDKYHSKDGCDHDEDSSWE